MSKTFTKEEVARHTSADDCWVIINDRVYDVSAFLDDHPGGKAVLLSQGGKDATDTFEMLHNDGVLKKYGPEMLVGVIAGSAADTGGDAPAPAAAQAAAPASSLPPPPTSTLATPVTAMLGIQYPVILAGMNAVAHADLVAAVSNAGGLGVLGGLSLTPAMLRHQIRDVKEQLTPGPTAKFGVDLALPQIGGGARKTNHDYTHGKLPELVDIMIEEGASLFVCAVGVPPKWVVNKLHAAGIPVMNMVGHPKHVDKALAVGVDLICAQGTEGGGHTGEIGTSVLVPMCVDRCKGRRSALTGGPVHVVAAGGVFDGRGLAAALAWGASAVWVGTRFVAAAEASAPARHKDALVGAGPTDTARTLIYSGRPLRTLVTPYVRDWHEHRAREIEVACARGEVPFIADARKLQASETGEVRVGPNNVEFGIGSAMPLLMGQAAGAIGSVEPAAKILHDMVRDAMDIIRGNAALISRL